MAYPYFVHNGTILPAEEATIPLSNVAYSYGYGVYESIRVSKSTAYFLDEHMERLQESAKIIGLEHNFTSEEISKSIDQIILKNKVDACNIKILLIGGRTHEDANLYIICLNPLFADRKLYKSGVHTITYEYERDFPHAKSLNMLPSYLAYRDASKAGAYDALLINRQGNIIEGTRTNFFVLKNKTIYSAPASEILLGVTRSKVLETARKQGYKIEETDLKLSNIQTYDQVFLTSTSSKIMPVHSINDKKWEAPNEELKALMTAFDDFLALQ